MATVAQEEVWVALYKAGIKWGEMTPYVDAAINIQRSIEVNLTTAVEYVAHVATATGCDPAMVPSILHVTLRLTEEIE